MARATTVVVGLAIMLALVLGVASTALGKNGQSLILGKANNVATKATGLIGKVATGSSLVVKNPKGGSALGLQVSAGQAPLTVNADAGKATNLDSDKLDGKSSDEFAADANQNGKADDAEHADQADNATNATNAGNADTVDGKHAAEFAAAAHDHDSRYYTETESDGRFVNEADHTKAAHDTLDIDADTLDGKNSSDFAAKAEAPGFDAQTVTTSVTLSATTTNIATVTVTAPADGFVILTGNGVFGASHTNGTATAPRAFLTKDSGFAPADNMTLQQVPSSAPSGTYYAPFSITRVFPVTAGERTFYMTANLGSGSSGSIVRHNLTGIFVKNQF